VRLARRALEEPGDRKASQDGSPEERCGLLTSEIARLPKQFIGFPLPQGGGRRLKAIGDLVREFGCLRHFAP
jgi:hypothetical protein